MQEVASSILVSSTSPPHVVATTLRVVGYTLGGLVAGEGSFFVSTRRSAASRDPRPRFRFEVAMASRDRAALEALCAFLGVGSIRDRPGERGWLPMSTFAVNSHRAHRSATIPFAERFLLPSAKRDQFEEWRAGLDDYEARYPKPLRQGSVSMLGRGL